MLVFCILIVICMQPIDNVLLRAYPKLVDMIWWTVIDNLLLEIVVQHKQMIIELLCSRNASIYFSLYLVLQRNIMCQQYMSHEAEVLRSKRRYAWSDQTAASVRRYYTTRPSLVLHLCTEDHRNQPTPEIKAGQENIAHLLSKYNSKLFVHLSAIIRYLRCICYSPIIFFCFTYLLTWYWGHGY